jgi:malonyl-CoA O-methyltransferase
MSATPPTPERALDPRAAGRIAARLAATSEAPWLHAESARRMADRLAVFRQPPHRIADLSGASGGPADLLAKACPGARVERAGQAAARPWWQRLVRAAQPVRFEEGQADLVWSVMMLHWAPDPPQALREWRQLLAPEGSLLFTTLGPGTLMRLRALYQAEGWGSPMAPLVDMHDLGDMLVAAGYEGPVMDQETLTLSWSSPEAALAELRGLGANADPARFAGLRTPRWRQRLLQALGAQVDGAGRVALSFEIVYGHAVRGADRGPAVSAETRVGLDEMSAMLKRRPAR